MVNISAKNNIHNVNDWPNCVKTIIFGIVVHSWHYYRDYKNI